MCCVSDLNHSGLLVNAFAYNITKRSHTQLDSRKQVIAFQDRVMTTNQKVAGSSLPTAFIFFDKFSLV